VKRSASVLVSRPFGPALVALVAAATVTVHGRPTQAAEARRQVKPGIDLIHRTGGNPAQDYWAARIDLSSPNIGLHASADNAGERAVNTLTFARNTDSIVALNTDWSDGRTPVGVAISDGAMWHRHIPNNRLGGHWGYMGCTIDKRCTMDRAAPLDVAPEFTDPTQAPYRFFQAVGANGVLLLKNGDRARGCYDNARNPRSAACLEADNTHLWLFAIDGRRAGASGMTCDEVRDLAESFACHNAVMFDGGGSTTLVVQDIIKNQPSDGSPRTVSNHLGITWEDAPDPRCAASPSGRNCDGTVIRACQGGRFISQGDCAGFGVTCGGDPPAATCMDPRCQAGPGGAFCASEATRGVCTDGVYAEEACPAGTVCGAAGCAPPPPDAAPALDAAPVPADATPTPPETDAATLADIVTPPVTDDARTPGTGDAAPTDADPAVPGDPAEPDALPPNADAASPGAATFGPIGASGRGGCQQGSAQDQIFYQSLGAIGLALFALWRRHTRR
jgi:hypothetical protein